jgi:myo-inositol catabolism protein IolS
MESSVAQPDEIGQGGRLFDRRRGVRPLIFGCEQLGGYNWGTIEVAEVEKAIAAALETGIVFFDTADCYGPFLSESRLGAAVRHARGRAVIATKFGVRLDAQGRRKNDTSPEWCREAVRGSLQRLGVDCIDLYQMHCHDGVTPLEDTIGELENLRASGLVGAWGLCNVRPADLPAAAWASCVSLQAELSLLSIEQEAVALEVCARGAHFLAYGVLAQGLLAGRYDAATRFGPEDRRSHQRYRNFHGERFFAGLEVLQELQSCASEIGCREGALAIAWVRSLHPRIWPIVGIKTRDQLQDALSATEIDVPVAVDGRLRAAAARFMTLG